MRKILLEDKVTDYIKKAIVNNCMFDKATLATPINDLPDDLKKNLHDGSPSIYDSCIKNNQNLLMYFRRYFLGMFDINYGKGPVEYAMGLARIAIIELGMFKGSNVDSQIGLLKQTVLFLHNSSDQALKSRYDGNLNGLSYDGLIRELNDERKAFNKANREHLSNMTTGNASDYTVVAINSYEDAEKYGSYVHWCVTYLETQYQNYTSGGRRFYFCLKKGFENIPKQIGEGCPLDEYGLSMIAVLVDSEGEPAHITTRWNHENDGEDNENLKTAEQLQKVTGLNFYAVFKPYTLEQLQAMGVTPLYAVQDLLDQGKAPEEIFDVIEGEDKRFKNVVLKDKWNIIDTNGNRLLSPIQWFNDAIYLKDGVSAVELNWQWNFLGIDGKLLSPNQWFDGVRNFNNGFGQVVLDKKWNFLGIDGKLLSPNQWFDGVGAFIDGTATVRLNHKSNWINTEGKLISPNQWFDSVYPFWGNFAVLELNSKKNMIDLDGKLLSPSLWFDEMSNFLKHLGLAKVSLKGNWNWINTEGKLLSPNMWFDYIWSFSEGFAEVNLNGKYNFMNTDGKLLSPELWFDDAIGFNNGFAEVELSHRKYYIDTDGKLYDYNTERPIESLQESKKKKKKPSAQSQVGNKINSGLMDAICYGGLEESKPDFYIGAEKGNHDYCHVTNGSAAPLNKSFNLSNDEYKRFFNSIGNYMNNHGLSVKPFPSVELNHKNQDGLFIYTGYYAPNEKKVVLFVGGRHPKDILRSFAHEMVHHAQNLRGENLSFTNEDNVKDNESLERLEAEAYLKGNLYFRKWTEYFKNGEQDALNESVEEYLNPDEVDLSSFKPKNELNPKFWVDGHLDSRIRMRLLDIAEDFIRYMGVDWAEPIDIILTGSLAGLNYDDKYSDIDVHIIFDYSDIDENNELVDNYFYTQKKLWNDEHKDLSIYGFPVELFVEDSKTDSNGNVYSLMKDRWVDEPDTSKGDNTINPMIKQAVRIKVSAYTKQIDKLDSEFDKGKDNEYILRKLSGKVDALLMKIKRDRQSGLEDSEYSVGNITFKSLRRNGYLAQLVELKKKIYDKSHSLP